MSDEGHRHRALAGHRIWHFDRLASTQDEARSGVESGRYGHSDVVLADEQSAGRGRRGRSWVTVPGRSLAVSVVLPVPPLRRPTRLVLLAAVAAARAAEVLGLTDVTIKWPNDLMRGERKIGGMLVETARAPDGTGAALLGFGLNLALRADDLPAELSARVGDLDLDDTSARERYLAAWLLELDAALAEIDTGADAARGAEFRRRSWLTGRSVELSVAGKPRRARVADVTVEGDLVLDGGETLRGELVELVAVLDSR